MAGETPDSIREAIIRARAQGLTYADTARILGIGQATVSRILRRYRETGSAAPKPRGGGKTSPLKAEILRRLIEARPDITQREIAAEFARLGVTTSIAAVGRALRRHGFTRKKRPSSPSSGAGQRTSPAAKPFRRR